MKIYEVINNNYCIGCGVCAYLDSEAFIIKKNENGFYTALVNSTSPISDEIDSICPFATNINEDEIAQNLYKNVNSIKFNNRIGYFLKLGIGYITEGDYRKNGSSGGFGSWISAKLLENKQIDGVIHVIESSTKNTLFEYGISTTINQIKKGAKSRYYPIEMSRVLHFVKSNPGKYLLVGVPCFIKSIRLLQMKDDIIKERIIYTLGLVCGHLKSDLFAKSLGWELGIHPDRLSNIDFRMKDENRKSDDYGVSVIGNNETEVIQRFSPTKELFTSNWGHGMFKYKACDYCDDVLAETADIVIGDAWLPEYLNDSGGTNIIIVRNEKIRNLIDCNSENMSFSEVSEDTIISSQIGGFRHKNEGLSFRLYIDEKKSIWHPEKRVKSSSRISRKRKKIYLTRLEVTKMSFIAYKQAILSNDFAIFKNKMIKYVKKIDDLYKQSIFDKIKYKIRNM